MENTKRKISTVTTLTPMNNKVNQNARYVEEQTIKDCEFKNYSCNLCNIVGHLTSMRKNKTRHKHKKKTYNGHFNVKSDSKGSD